MAHTHICSKIYFKSFLTTLGRCVPFHVQFLEENGQNNRLAPSPLGLVPLLPHLSGGSRISLGGRQPSGGCQPTILPNFPKNYIKLKGFGPQAVADPGGAEGAMPPPRPVKISHKKDGRQRWPYRFHVSRPPSTRPLDPLLPGGGSRPLRPPLDPPLHLENLVTNDLILGIFFQRNCNKMKKI